MYYYTYPPYAYYPNSPEQQFYPQPTTAEPRMNSHFEDISQALIKGMEGENEAIDFYKRLVKMAPNNMTRTAVEHALEDEKIHLQLFIELYKKLTGKSPNYRKTKKEITDFKQGIRDAFHDELEAYEQYRNNYLLTFDQTIRDTFFLAMSDEMEHATRFSFVYHIL